MQIESDIKLDYNNVLIRPKRSTLGSRNEVDLTRTFTFKNTPGITKFWRGVPIMASNMDGVGTFKMADTLAKHELFTCLVKTYSVSELVSFFQGDDKRKHFTAMSIGITQADSQKFDEVYTQLQDNLLYVCIDVANGYSQVFLNFVKTFKEKYPDVVVIAGNVVTADQTQELILNGASVVKAGIGSGAACLSRIKTGIGYPQLSAVIECADAAHGLGGLVIADGGCTTPGDVVKAIAGGADFVMLGSMFAGHEEGGGQVISKFYETNELDDKGYRVREVKSFVQFYGMSSKAANDKHFGGLKDYRTSEGREVLVPYRGKVNDTVQDILGGIRSACTYVGAAKLKNLSKCTTFIRVTDTHNRVFEK
jgi:GMP reductase